MAQAMAGMVEDIGPASEEATAKMGHKTHILVARFTEDTQNPPQESRQFFKCHKFS